MRKLAYIVNVAELTPIEGADRIELARVKGWRAIVKKGAFQVGQKAVFFEIDSFLPMMPQYEFLKQSSYRKLSNGAEGYRLRTCKLRGQISQGLLMSLEDVGISDAIEVDTDVTEMLDVLEWQDVQPQPAMRYGGISNPKNKPFPPLIPKTDEERVQTYEHLAAFVDKEIYITEKVDGCSFTAYYLAEEDKFGVCSRNCELDRDPENAYWQMAELLGLEEKMRKCSNDYLMGKSFAIQGEMFGYGIQGNPYKMGDRQILWFNAYHITDCFRMNYYQLHGLLTNMYLNIVPELALEVDTKDRSKMLDRDFWIALADGKSVLGDTPREGIVVRRRDMTAYSFKAISNSYLLAKGE